MSVRDRLLREIERIPRLLVIRLRSLGDSILSLPLLEALAQYRSDLALDVVVESPFAPVFAEHPAVSRVFVLRARGGSEGITRARAIADVRRRRYGAVLNLHGGTTSLLLALGSGAPLRIGSRGYRNLWAYNVCIPASSEVWGRKALHTVEHQLSLMRWLDLPVPPERRPRLPLRPAALERVRARLRAAGLETGRYCLVHPTATLFTKQWQEQKFAALADAVRGEFGAPVVFSAAATEKGTLDTIAASAAADHVYWADLTLEELFALIEGCGLFIGNDSGPTHAAAAFGKPIVVVWGSSNAVAWRPWGSDYEMIRSDLPCMPCPGYTCAAFGAPRCILDLEVGAVLEACRRIVSRAGCFR
jgi:heptosyltransferase-3